MSHSADNKRITDEDILKAYRKAGSVRKAGLALGLSGQGVHVRLQKIGATNPVNTFTDEDKKVLIAEYQGFADAGRLDDLAEKLGRTKQFICRKAKHLGLTNKARKRPYLADSTRLAMTEWHQENDHPRGAKGMKHTAKARAIISQKSVESWASKTDDEKSEITLKSLKSRLSSQGTLAPPRPNTTWKAGWREVGGNKKYYRSRWEANYARYLEWLRLQGEISGWSHEPETFWFEAIKRGVRSYLPDFRVWENDGSSNLHEVKGWMDSRSKTTLKRMAKYHPQETIILIREKDYNAIKKKVGALIEDWE